MTGRLNPLKPVQSAIMLVMVLTATLAMLLPLVLLSHPRDNEVWPYQAISEMKAEGFSIPVLNGERLTGQNPVTLTGFSFLPLRGIHAFRVVTCVLGCILVASIFLYSLSLWGAKTAMSSSFITATSLGFVTLYGTLNTTVLPVTSTVIAYLLFSHAYLKGSGRSWYLASYVLAGIAAITGGFTFLVFFAFGAILLILLDLEPIHFFSIHLIPGVLINLTLIIAFFLTYRIMLGSGFVSGLMYPGEDLGLISSLKAIVTYSAPWIPLMIPAWIYGEGPGKQQVWRTLLPLRIAFVLVLAVLWLSSRCLPQYAMVAMPFGAMLIGGWVSRDLISGDHQGSLASLMVLFSGVLVFGAVLFFFLFIPFREGFIGMKQAAALVGFACGALIFFILMAKRKLLAGLIVVVVACASVVWCLAWLNQQDQWEQKISFMERISRSSPLVVYEDDLIMRGYLSAVGSKPVILQKDIVLFRDTAFLAVSAHDLDKYLNPLKTHTNPVVLHSYQSENTYALVMISPKKKIE
jgi:4-amino-4-deoxy-L-arabinose transferase-like glycosyltransferase